MKNLFTQFCQLILIVFLISCGASNSTTNQNGNVEHDNRLKYLALGDSYTIGEAIQESNNWPNLLVKSLREKKYDFAKPRIIAKTGWRTDELLSAMGALSIDDQYEMISILIGVNNQYQGKEMDVFVKELDLIISKAIKHSKKGAKGIFAFSIPDYSVMPALEGKHSESIAGQINDYNELYKSKCAEKGIRFYDVTEMSRGAKNNHEYQADDKLHLSAKMYEIWIMNWVDSIIKDIL